MLTPKDVLRIATTGHGDGSTDAANRNKKETKADEDKEKNRVHDASAGRPSEAATVATRIKGEVFCSVLSCLRCYECYVGCAFDLFRLSFFPAYKNYHHVVRLVNERKNHPPSDHLISIGLGSGQTTMLDAIQRKHCELYEEDNVAEL
uniref:Uncharacterized protein n=1 Tax=Tenebrio molitor TaxID=7067 RepID=A0A8J6H426_TENMO|nr:hypothetical protein GEV33_015041 [Tenebrio molitor]